MSRPHQLAFLAAFAAMAVAQPALAKAAKPPASCSAAALYKASNTRKSLIEEPAFGKNGAVYAQFTEDFWRFFDKLRPKDEPATVGDIFDLVQASFSKAANKDASSLISAGATAHLMIETSQAEDPVYFNVAGMEYGPIAATDEIRQAIHQRPADKIEIRSFNLKLAFMEKDKTVARSMLAENIRADLSMADPASHFQPWREQVSLQLVYGGTQKPYIPMRQLPYFLTGCKPGF